MAGYHYHYNFYLRFLVSPNNTQLLSGHCYMSFILVSFFVTVHSYREKKQNKKQQNNLFPNEFVFKWRQLSYLNYLSNGFKTFCILRIHWLNLIFINHMNTITITEAMCINPSVCDWLLTPFPYIDRFSLQYSTLIRHTSWSLISVLIGKCLQLWDLVAVWLEDH